MHTPPPLGDLQSPTIPGFLVGQRVLNKNYLNKLLDQGSGPEEGLLSSESWTFFCQNDGAAQFPSTGLPFLPRPAFSLIELFSCSSCHNGRRNIPVLCKFPSYVFTAEQCCFRTIANLKRQLSKVLAVFLACDCQTLLPCSLAPGIRNKPAWLPAPIFLQSPAAQAI